MLRCTTTLGERSSHMLHEKGACSALAQGWSSAVTSFGVDGLHCTNANKVCVCVRGGGSGDPLASDSVAVSQALTLFFFT